MPGRLYRVQRSVLREPRFVFRSTFGKPSSPRRTQLEASCSTARIGLARMGACRGLIPDATQTLLLGTCAPACFPHSRHFSSTSYLGTFTTFEGFLEALTKDTPAW
jgi:hypothetical protein